MDPSLARSVKAFPIGLLSMLAAVSCTGTIDDPGAGGGGGGDSPFGAPPGARSPGTPGEFVPPERELAATVGLRRLSTNEYDATVLSLLGDDSGAGSYSLPPDVRRLFDDTTEQEKQIGETLISTVDRVAGVIAAGFVNDRSRRDRLIGCQPADPTCLRQFVSRLGRLALRRPLSPEDEQIFLAIPQAAGTTGDFYRSIELIVSAFLQDPEFLHQTAVGAPVTGASGLFKLGPWELASRLSYLLWGDMPSPELLDHVEEGGLATPEDVAATTTRMLADARAARQVHLFHGLWLGYQSLSLEHADAMKAETNALLSKVVFEDHRPWQEIFRADQTFVSYELAKSYGFPVAAGSKPKWVSYPTTAVPRRGILSHATVLSLGNKFGDTSPTKRGREIRQRLMCQKIEQPSAALLAMFKANTDLPPPGAGSLCKWDRYKANRDTSPACAYCHNQMDLVGFGLESFDAYGRYRTQQSWKKDAKGLPVLVAAGTPGAERCPIEGNGQLMDSSGSSQTFSGPGALADLLAGSGVLNDCVLQQLYRFGMAVGDLGDADKQALERFRTYLGSGDFMLDDVLRKFVSSPAFAHRRVDLKN